MTENPLVSVIIPTYERFDLVQRAIDSVLRQSLSHQIEILVVDDCSSDDRYDTLISKYTNTSVKYLRTEINSRIGFGPHSQGMTKNKGLEAAQGKWIAFLDDDDYYTDSEKLYNQIKYMERYDCLMSCTNMTTQLGPYFSHFNHGVRVENGVYILSKNIINKDNLINNSTCIIHNSIIKQVGLFNVLQYEDWDYWKRAMKYTDCVYINEETTWYETESTKYYQ
jgi:glycosyltransferase involved in cell wall biosynthesis